MALALAAPFLTGAGSARPRPARAGVRVSIVGQNHQPRVGQRWHYVVRVSSASGQPLSGTETTYYTFGGTVVGTERPTNVRFRGGVYRDTIIFPAAAVGHRLALKAVVKTARGSASASWAITVQR